MLAVEGVTLQPNISPRQLLARAIEAPGLQRASSQFEAIPPLSLDARDKCVCVLQGESCTVPFDHGISVGSQDATTCVIAFIVTVCGVSCLHIDEDTCNKDYLERRLLVYSDCGVVRRHAVLLTRLLHPHLPLVSVLQHTWHRRKR